MHVVESGRVDGQPIVFLHGLIGSTAWWDPVLPAFAEWRVVRIDLLGHGGSTAPYSGYGVAAQADRVADALDRIGVSRAIVVGHSFGGLVATALAQQAPGLVRAVSLIGTPPSAESIAGERANSRLLAAPVLGPLVWRLRLEPLARAALRASIKTEAADLDRIVAASLRVDHHTCVATYAAGFEFMCARTVPERLARLPLPVQVIFGGHEQRRRPAKVEDYRSVPGVRIDIVADSGHTPMFDDPETTAAFIADFASHPRWLVTRCA
ncbi:alpha/beta fold hydrolase [Flexivirga sp. B27]